MGIVAFDYQRWILRYPEFASVSEELAQMYFEDAELYCDNAPKSRIRDEKMRALLLGMLTAHIASLNAALNGRASSPLVGRINSASQGSVSAQTQFDVPAGSAQWFAQTKYGAAYWEATAAYRTMLYIPGPVPNMDPFRPW
jgi:hypothetical protein